MNSFAVITFVACLAAANAGWLHGPSAHILQGPSSKTTLVGPEGSVISAVAPGGQIVHEEHPGVIAHAAPVHGHIAPVIAHAAPLLAHAAPVIAHAGPIFAHAAPVVAPHASIVAHAAPATIVAHSSAYGHDSTVVAGPSGTIATGHAAHGPVVAHAAPVFAHAAPIVAHSASVIAHGALDIHGHEGQYVHDHSESLYDDGSYKPHVYHH